MSISKKKIGITLSLIVCAVLAVVALSPSGMATATAPAMPMAISASAPIVNSDGTVTFSLRAPQAADVKLNWQHMRGASPAADPYPMTKDANGVWSITMGPSISPNNLDWVGPNWYGYGFIVDGVKIADPANRDIWSGATSAWSWVMVPGPGTEFMADDPAVPHGAVATVRYFSKLTQTERQMQVYTPPGYNHDNRVYPVFYLLHGGGGNDTDWIVNMRANYILDNLIAQGKAVPIIVVMPDTNVGGGTLVTQDLFPQELLGSIVPYIEENYRTASGAKNRALAGLSMGNAHARNTLFQDPGAFAYIGLFSSTPPQAYLDDLVQNHLDLLTNPAINKDTKLLWITKGGPGYGTEPGVPTNQINYAAWLAFLDQYHIKYTFVPGSEIGANYGHVWDTWRKDLFTFAQLLFK
jgi:enterochelin esterase-like enzyme